MISSYNDGNKLLFKLLKKYAKRISEYQGPAKMFDSIELPQMKLDFCCLCDVESIGLLLILIIIINRSFQIFFEPVWRITVSKI
jgi:hypothetical protein